MLGNPLKDIDFNPVIHLFQDILALEETKGLPASPRY